MKLSPQELQEWMVLLIIKRTGSDFSEEPLLIKDIKHYLKFVTSCLLMLPDSVLNSIIGDEKLYMTEHHDTFLKYPKPLEELLSELKKRGLVKLTSELGYTITLQGSDYFRILTRKQRDFREKTTRIPV